MGNKNYNVFDRRLAMKNLAIGSFTQDDVNTLYNDPTPSENYGKTQTFQIDKVTGNRFTMIHATESGNPENSLYGSRHEVNQADESIPYWVTDSWGNGSGIRIDTAYRIIDQNEEILTVKKVRDFSELERISGAMIQDIRKAF